jgi:hypothetical protein
MVSARWLAPPRRPSPPHSLRTHQRTSHSACTVDSRIPSRRRMELQGGGDCMGNEVSGSTLARFWALKNDGQLPSSLMHDSLSPTGYRLKPCTPRRICVSRAQIRSYTLGIRPFASWSRSPRHAQIHCPATSHPLPEVRRPSATKGTSAVCGDPNSCSPQNIIISVTPLGK